MAQWKHIWYGKEMQAIAEFDRELMELLFI